jgi:hypothetical protein
MLPSMSRGLRRLLIVLAICGGVIAAIAGRFDGDAAGRTIAASLSATAIALLALVVWYVWRRSVLAGTQIRRASEEIDRTVDLFFPKFGAWAGPIVGIGAALAVIIGFLLRHWIL